MKKIVIILNLFCCCFLFSQKSGTVQYIVKTIDFVPKEMTGEIDATIKMAKKQTFVLKFNSPISSEFKREEVVENDDEISKFGNFMATKRFTCDYAYFTNSSEKIEYFKKDDGAIIKNDLVSKKWEITTENKTIDKYLCYKAIYKYDYVGRDKKLKTRIITAWFAPSLPYSYGPKNYNGLPGLILELQDWDTTFLAAKIDLSETELKIDFPKGKTVSQEEYDKTILSRN
jgi:GLPGLI family protein